MSSQYPGSTVRLAGSPMFRILVSFPIACFCCALVTDLAYLKTADMTWADFSAWLLAVGMVFGVLAAVAGLVDLIRLRRTRASRPVWPVALGALIVLALGLVNNFVHSRDAWTSVVPQGLVLSVLTVIVMLATAWFGATITRAAAPYPVGAPYPAGVPYPAGGPSASGTPYPGVRS